MGWEALFDGLSNIASGMLNQHPDRCSITAQGDPTSDGGGGYAQTPDPVASDIACSYIKATGKEKIVGNAEVEIGDLIVTLAEQIEVPANAIIDVAARDAIPALKFRVKTQLRDSSMNITMVLATESAADA